MDKKLYEIEAELLAVFNELEENEGELTLELEEQLKISREELQEKLIGYAKYIANKTSDIDAREKEIERLSKKNKTDQKHVDFLLERMKISMKQFGEKKIKTPLFNISISESKYVDILNEEGIPVDYLNTPTPPKPTPDKNKIKKYLEDLPGKATDWAKISEREKLSIK